MTTKGQFNKEMIDETYKDSSEWTLLVNSLLKIIDIKKISLNSREKKLINELKQEVKRISLLKKGSSRAENDWIKHANLTRSLVIKEDPEEFLRWFVIQNTMNVTNSFFVAKELAYLINSDKWNSKWSRILTEINLGNFVPFVFYPKCSGNTIHTTYMISQFEEKTNFNISKADFIFEFGGGYGNLCRLIHNLGYKGIYIIFDFPIFIALQKFYLKSAGFRVYNHNQLMNKQNGIYCIDNMKNLNSSISQLNLREKKNNLFIASWSLSESPLEIREKIIKFMPLFGNFLIGYQDKFGEVNNRYYFKKLTKSFPEIIWHNWAITHLSAHNFLIGSLEEE